MASTPYCWHRFIALTCVFALGCGPEVITQKKQPASTQARLRQLLTIMESKEAHSDPQLEAQFYTEFMSLVTGADHHPVEFVQDLIAFEATENSEKASTLAHVVLDKSDISGTSILEAVVDKLDAPEPRVKRIAIGLLGSVEGSCQEGPDFSHYYGRIVAKRRDHNELETVLSERMFTVSASHALRTFVQAMIDDGEQRKPFLWAGHVVDDMLWERQYGFLKPTEIPSDVAPQLDLMAARPEWWARLYVAAVLAQHKELATPELITKLRRYDNELVRKVIEQISPTPPEP